MTLLPEGRSFYGFAPMQYHPIANLAVYFVSLVRCSTFYVEDSPQQRPTQSFKEPQSVTPVAWVSFQTLPDSYAGSMTVSTGNRYSPFVSKSPEPLLEDFGDAKFIPHINERVFFGELIKKRRTLLEISNRISKHSRVNNYSSSYSQLHQG